MDAKEIYQAVLEECLEEIDKIKKEYAEELISAISSRLEEAYDERINILEERNKELVKRVSKLEGKINKEKVESSSQSFKGNNGSVRLRDDELERIRFRAFEYDGWLYYENKKMGNFLYRVRTDGKGNEQLTDYSVTMGFEYVKNNKFYFRDKNLSEHSIII